MFPPAALHRVAPLADGASANGASANGASGNGASANGAATGGAGPHGASHNGASANGDPAEAPLLIRLDDLPSADVRIDLTDGEPSQVPSLPIGEVEQ